MKKKIGIVITCTAMSGRCLSKNTLLVRATLLWVKRMNMLDRTAVVGDNPYVLEMAKSMGVACVVERPRSGHWRDFLAGYDALVNHFVGAAALRETQHAAVVAGYDALRETQHAASLHGVVQAQITAPMRERWLLEEVCQSMLENPEAETVVSSANCADTGALHGRPVAVLEMMRAMCDVGPLPTVYVLQNADNNMDVDWPYQIPTDKNEFARKLREKDIMRHPAQLPEEVVIVGSNHGTQGKGLGAWIDAQPCVIRVNHLNRDHADDVGTKLDYHFTKYQKCAEEFKDAQTPPDKLVAGRWHCLETPWGQSCRYGVTPSMEAVGQGLLRTVASASPPVNSEKGIVNSEQDESKFITTGLMAIVWAMQSGAKRCTLIGFGDGTDKPKIDLRTGTADQFAAREWLNRENAVLRMLRDAGVVRFADATLVNNE